MEACGGVWRRVEVVKWGDRKKFEREWLEGDSKSTEDRGCVRDK